MTTFTYPTNAEMTAIGQDKMAVLTMDDPIFSIMPIRNVQAPVLIWEQMDNYVGLQQLRGLGGAPQRVKKTGGKRYTMEPGAYGEFETIDEVELMLRRPYGKFSGAVPIHDLTGLAQDKLISRRVDRLRYIGWTLITTGTFAVNLPTGQVGHTDQFTLQQAAGSQISNPQAGTPLQDFRNVQLLSRGHSVTFNANAKAFMNRKQFNKLVANTNPADLFGKRVAGLATVLGLHDINAVLMQEDLPQIVIYDNGYLNDAGVFVPFIADNTTVIVGDRPGGQKVMEYLMAMNINNEGEAPGPYQKVIDKGENTVPRSIEVHDGHNGGPAIYFPSAVIILTTT